jgi:hypothetical protein
MWRARFGKGFGPVVRQTTKGINEYIYIYTFLSCGYNYFFINSGWKKNIAFTYR